MFNVQFGNSRTIYKVYAVKNTFRGIKFLFYINDSWQWRNAEWYKPVDVGDSIVVDVGKNFGENFNVEFNVDADDFIRMKTHAINSVKAIKDARAKYKKKMGR